MQDNVRTIQLEGYACIFHEPDQQGDVILPGAFGQDIASIVGTPILWQHHPYTPIGKVVDAKEDTKGIRVLITLCLDTQVGCEAYHLVKSGVLSGLSIGFTMLKSCYGTGKVRRILHRIKLKEISLVTFPAHERARIHIDKKTLH